MTYCVLTPLTVLILEECLAEWDLLTQTLCLDSFLLC